ncbi:MAG: hypothetical protein WDM90_04515 [Ferruginibacter sp.]
MQKIFFYNDRDKDIYNNYDDISKISFSDNMVSKTVTESLANGFIKSPLTVTRAGVF